MGITPGLHIFALCIVNVWFLLEFSPAFSLWPGHLESEILSSGSCWKGREDEDAQLTLRVQHPSPSHSHVDCACVCWTKRKGKTSCPLLRTKAVPHAMYYPEPQLLACIGSIDCPHPGSGIVLPMWDERQQCPELIKYSVMQSWSDLNPASCFLSPFRQER